MSPSFVASLDNTTKTSSGIKQHHTNNQSSTEPSLQHNTCLQLVRINTTSYEQPRQGDTYDRMILRSDSDTGLDNLGEIKGLMNPIAVEKNHQYSDSGAAIDR